MRQPSSDRWVELHTPYIQLLITVEKLFQPESTENTFLRNAEDHNRHFNFLSDCTLVPVCNPGRGSNLMSPEYKSSATTLHEAVQRFITPTSPEILAFCLLVTN